MFILKHFNRTQEHVCVVNKVKATVPEIVKSCNKTVVVTTETTKYCLQSCNRFYNGIQTYIVKDNTIFENILP